MYYCSNCDICYEERNCPLCDAKEGLKNADEEIIRQEKTIESLNDRICGLEEKIETLNQIE